MKWSAAVIVAVLSALAEPTRLEAARRRAHSSEHCVCEPMRNVGAIQSRTSRHMQVPKQAGLVVDRRNAQWARCRINPDLPPSLAHLIEAAPERQIVVTKRVA